jgi:hypothetical protein
MRNLVFFLFFSQHIAMTKITVVHGPQSTQKRQNMIKPFGDNMDGYWANCLSPLPTKDDGKAPGLAGITGRKGKPDLGKLKEVKVKMGHRNLAISGQIHKNGVVDDSQSLVTIDNDDETGESLKVLAKNSGVALPPTVTVTSRGANNPRRKYIYRVRGIQHNLKGNVIDEKIDICSDTQRCVVMEGIHKGTGNPIVIYGPDGEPLGRIPKLNDFAWMPEELLAFLTKTNTSSKAIANLENDEPAFAIESFIDELDEGPASEWVSDFIDKVDSSPAFGNQELFEFLCELVVLCNLWERGTFGAFNKLKHYWLTREHKSGSADKEWEHALFNAVNQNWQGPIGTRPSFTMRELALKWQEELSSDVDYENRLFKLGKERGLFKQVVKVAQITGDNRAALLVAVLAQVAFEIPWDVYFESALGKDALNLLVVLVGPSGAGKSIITQHAEDDRYFKIPRLREYTGPSDAVSGEAMLAGLVGRYSLGKGKYFYDWRNPEHNKLYNIDEIGMLEARNSRQGSTIRETMLSLHSGSPISRESASGENWAKPKNSYRIVFQIGAQPKRSEIFFTEDAIAAGFAGRCLWADVTRDEDLIFKPQESIEPMVIPLPDWKSMSEVTYFPTEELAEEIWSNRNLYARGEGDPMESHAVRNKARIATILAAADGRTFMVDEDVELAHLLMQISRETYKSALKELVKSKAEAQAQKGRSDGLRQHHGQIRKEELDLHHHANRAKSKLLELCGDEPMTTAQLRKVYRDNFKPETRGIWPQVIDHLAKDSSLPSQLQKISSHEEERLQELESNKIGQPKNGE